MATTTERLKIDKLDNSNWRFWSFKMYLHFQKYDLLDVADGTVPLPTAKPGDEGREKERSEWIQQSKLIYRDICSVCTDDKVFHVMSFLRDLDCGPKAWKTLQDLHQSKGFNAPLRHLRSFLIAEMDANTTLEDHFRRLSELEHEVVQAGKKVDTDLLQMVYLYSLTPEYDPVVISIESSNPLPPPEDIKSRLLGYDERLTSRDLKTDDPSALKASSAPSSRFKSHSSKKVNASSATASPSPSSSKHKDKGKEKGKEKWKCEWCKHSKGHKTEDCRQLKEVMERIKGLGLMPEAGAAGCSGSESDDSGETDSSDDEAFNAGISVVNFSAV